MKREIQWNMWGSRLPGSMKPSSSMLKAIKEFPTPTCVADVRSFIGICNTFGPWVPEIAANSCHMRKLLRKDAVFVWSAETEHEFQTLKDILQSDLVLERFDPVLKTKVLVDAARLKGLGYALLQLSQEGRPRLIWCGSRRVSKAE